MPTDSAPDLPPPPPPQPPNPDDPQRPATELELASADFSSVEITGGDKSDWTVTVQPDYGTPSDGPDGYSFTTTEAAITENPDGTFTVPVVVHPDGSITVQETEVERRAILGTPQEDSPDLNTEAEGWRQAVKIVAQVLDNNINPDWRPGG
jgi:hypothetical protein